MPGSRSTSATVALLCVTQDQLPVAKEGVTPGLSVVGAACPPRWAGTGATRLAPLHEPASFCRSCHGAGLLSSAPGQSGQSTGLLRIRSGSGSRKSGSACDPATTYVADGDYDTALDYAQQVLDKNENHASALATAAILVFQQVWSNLEASNYYISDEGLKSLVFYMNTLASANGNSVAGQGVQAAASLLMFLPNLILFCILQNKVMNTMAHSGIK